MQRFPFLLLFIQFALQLSAQTPANAGWKSFTDSAGKFTAKYPSDWTNKVKEGNRVFFTSPAESDADKFHENVNINVSQNPAYGTTLKIKDMFPAVTEQLKPAFRDFQSESQRFFK